MRKKFLGKKPVTRRQRGLQIIEVSLMMPVMLLLLGVIGEYGRYFHMRSTLLRATAVGARYMTDKPDTTTEKNSAKSMTVCGKTATCTASQAIYSGFAETNVNVTITGNTTAGKYVVVETTGINYVPVFSLKKLSTYFSKNNDTLKWGETPVVVRTRMQYTGS